MPVGAGSDPAQLWGPLVARLAATREDRRLSQRSLGARLGMAEIVVGKWEHVADYPSLHSLVHWAAALELSPVVVRADGSEIEVTVIPRGREPLELFIARRVGLTLRHMREEQRRTQGSLGGELGVSEWTVRMWESARRDPRVLHLLAWADALSCAVVLRAGTP